MFYEIFRCHLFMHLKIKRSSWNRIAFLNFKIFVFIPELKTFFPFYFKVQNLQLCCIIIKHVFMHLQELIDQWDNKKFDYAYRMKLINYTLKSRNES